MTDPCRDCPICAPAADIWAAACANVAAGIERPWDEGLEAQMDFIAATFDEETGRARPLGPRRDRP